MIYLRVFAKPISTIFVIQQYSIIISNISSFKYLKGAQESLLKWSKSNPRVKVLEAQTQTCDRTSAGRVVIKLTHGTKCSLIIHLHHNALFHDFLHLLFLSETSRTNYVVFRLKSIFRTDSFSFSLLHPFFRLFSVWPLFFLLISRLLPLALSATV